MNQKYLLYKGRLFYVFLLLALQTIVLYGAVSWVSGYIPLDLAAIATSAVMAIWLLSRYQNPSYKMFWIIIIFLLPVFGIIIYLIYGNKEAGNKVHNAFKETSSWAYARFLEPGLPALTELKSQNPAAASQAEYIINATGLQLHSHTYTEYLCSGEVFFARLINELKKAKKFIYMEFFKISQGIMWNSILEILKEKAALGLDVCVIYDDMGSIYTLPSGYHKKLEQMGVKCAVFNPMIPFLAIRQINNRDHRKICVIDGQVGFTGGINLADEYINALPKYGHWLDHAILLKGPAVRNLLAAFLAVWNFLRKDTKDPDCMAENSDDCCCGFVLPYTENPYTYDDVAMNAYLNMICKSKRYLYITTPYLVLDFALLQALCTAAMGGVDVRICLPGIPDKKIESLLAKSHFSTLARAGVKIYLYSPGFLHAKTFVSDDETAIIGSINLNFRSLFLDFEDAVWMYRTHSVQEIKEDYLQTLKKCRQLTMNEINRIPWYTRLLYTLAKLLSPLL